MKKVLALAVCAISVCFSSVAQERGLNISPDEIIGTYYVSHGGENSKVRVFKDKDGTFSAQVFWVEHSTDENGNIRLDEKNPDKSLRDTPCDRIIILENLEYNAGKKRWDSGKIYDPTRGLKANVVCSFDSATSLRVRGSLMGFGETIFWEKIGE